MTGASKCCYAQGRDIVWSARERQSARKRTVCSTALPCGSTLCGRTPSTDVRIGQGEYFFPLSSDLWDISGPQFCLVHATGRGRAADALLCVGGVKERDAALEDNSVKYLSSVLRCEAGRAATLAN
ncbi:hypothetical protein TRVL_08959 [Trypanosoma vivax]|nr:hypothetical protein TRVL_08959 [Trypanosoma vivax]